jgi:hypothetical protein
MSLQGRLAPSGDSPVGGLPVGVSHWGLREFRSQHCGNGSKSWGVLPAAFRPALFLVPLLMNP